MHAIFCKLTASETKEKHTHWVLLTSEYHRIFKHSIESVSADSFNAHCSALIAADTCQIWWKFSGGWHAHPERLCLSAGACVVVPAEWRRTQWPCFTSCWYAGVICIATKHHLCIVSVLRGLSGRECMGRPSPGPPFLQSGIPRPRRTLFPWERMFPDRKHGFIHGNTTSQSEIGQDNSHARNTGARCKIERGPQGAQGFLPFALP